jgi:hypothetical protein
MGEIHESDVTVPSNAETSILVCVCSNDEEYSTRLIAHVLRPFRNLRWNFLRISRIGMRGRGKYLLRLQQYIILTFVERLPEADSCSTRWLILRNARVHPQ